MSATSDSPRRWSGWLLCLVAAIVLAVLALGGTLLYLKLHESQLVFRVAESHAHTTDQLPAGAERLVIYGPGGSELAGVILRSHADNDTGFWILHLHGNAVSAFSAELLRHCESLRQTGFNVLSFDYRGFGMSPGDASEAHMDQDTEAAFAALISRGLPHGCPSGT